MKCDHCNSNFSSLSSLNNHIKTAKYCIEKRGEPTVNIFNCLKCSKSFSSKRWLLSHESKCGESIETLLVKVNKYEHSIKYLEKEVEYKNIHIKELEKQIQEIALKAVSRPTTTNKTQINNFIQQLQPVTEEKLKESVSNLTIDHIKKGPEGYAQYALEYPLKDKIICVDYSRRKVKFKDKDGNVITDPEMAGLATKFFNSIKDKNKELVCLYANELKEKLGDDEIMDTMVKIFDYKMNVDKGSEGEKSDFHHDFVRQICSQTIKE